MTYLFRSFRLLWFLGMLTTSLVCISSCGEKKGSSGGGRAMGTIEAKFYETARTYKVPARFMMAVAYMESRLTPNPSTSIYLTDDDPDAEESQKGLEIAETAFGLSLQKIGISEAASDSLSEQIESYGKWLSSYLVERNIQLSENPNTPSEKFDWIWEMAAAHRSSSTHSRNVRVIFAKELINILNKGFIWQDPATGETIKFQKESGEIKIETFPQDKQNLFQLTTQRPEVDSAQYLRLGRVNSETIENKPKYVYVIHCPFSFSACLELQHQESDDDVRLEAHYIIPPNDDITPEAFQVSKHHNAVKVTDKRGRTDFVTDAVVIMLTGQSGRIVNGFRDPGHPTWFSKWQLEQMGNIVNDVCISLENDGYVSTQECLKEGTGVRFQIQGSSENFRWGDIADFDPLIFYSYIYKPGGLDGETVFELSNQTGEYQAGQEIPIKLLFNRQVKHIELERLVRCQDQKLTWALISREEVRSQSQFTFLKKLWDSGANGDGSQYLRAKVYNQDNELIGWDISEIILKGYEKEASAIAPDACLAQ